MKFSIIIPTFKNYPYLELCVNSILKNSKYDNEIIVHLNGIDDKSKDFIFEKKLKYTQSEKNLGLCSGVNLAATKANNDYIIYSHDDMYFLPNWDFHLLEEIKKINHNNFYLSLTQISHSGPVKGSLQHIQFDCGDNIDNFDEKKLLNEFENLKFKELQGSHWAPHVIHKSLWNKIGGFSEEFNPGFASDPDLNMKLWLQGVRIFKNVLDSKIYHFGSLTTRKNAEISKNNGKKTFLLKWGISIDFFVKHYLKRGSVFKAPLENPNKNIRYYFDFLLSKSKYLIAKSFK